MIEIKTSDTDTVLETNRLVLRVFRAEDLDALAAIESDPEVMKYYESGPRSRESAERNLRYFVELQAKHGFSPWAVVPKVDNKCIGFTGLLPQSVDGFDEVEVCYKLAKGVWGQGFATEGALACRDWSFRNLPVQRVISIIHPENAASIRVAGKIGMSHVKDADYSGIACRIYAINRDEWESLKV